MATQDENKLNQVIDGTKEGYEAEIADSPEQFFDPSGNPLPQETVEVNAAVSSLPDKDGRPLTNETPVMLVGGVRVKYRKVPSMLFNTAKSFMAARMKKNKPRPQEFIADDDGTRILGDQNPAYLDALLVWENEWDNINELISTGVSLFSGLILVDGMPHDDQWLPYLQEMFELSGLDWDTAFQSYLYDESKIKELYFKQYIVLSNSEDMAAFTVYQQEAKLADSYKEAAVEAAVRLFRP